MRVKETKAGYVGSSWVAEMLGVSRPFARKLMLTWPETEVMAGNRLRLRAPDAKRRCSGVIKKVKHDGRRD